jgi:hypothetical protein
MDRKTWFSDVYHHYKIQLHRDEQTKTLYHRFVCKYGDRNHASIDRQRMKASHGTTNLARAAEACNARRGIVDSRRAEESLSLGPYSEARHRTIIALRCAESSRAAHLVTDKYYRMEVELLRPGTTIPSEHTVSRDLKLLHQQLAKEGQAYFMVCALFIHDLSNLNLLLEEGPPHPSCDRWLDKPRSNL